MRKRRQNLRVRRPLRTWLGRREEVLVPRGARSVALDERQSEEIGSNGSVFEIIQWRRQARRHGEVDVPAFVAREAYR